MVERAALIRKSPSLAAAPRRSSARESHPLRATFPGLGTGARLSEPVRRAVEPRFGHSFSDVRVFADDRAEQVAAAHSAEAVSVGSDVVLGRGASTRADDPTLIHELAHVAQQHHIPVSRADGLPVSSPGDALEAKAERSASAVRSGRFSPPVPLLTPVLARQGTRRPVVKGALKVPPLGTNLQLPATIGSTRLFEVNAHKVRCLAAVRASQESAIRGAITPMARQLAGDNALITAASDRVKLLIIASTTTRFALLHGTPVLMIDPADAEVETVAHEMGHALFRHYGIQASAKPTPNLGAVNARQRLAHLFGELAATKQLTFHGKTHAAGHWMVDPSQWWRVKAGSKAVIEHPWDDPDEFFGSAKAAFQIDRVGLRNSMARFARLDPRVKQPAKELLRLLGGLLSNRLPGTALAAAARKPAQARLAKLTGPSNVQATVMPRTPLAYLLVPSSRPAPKSTTPGVTAPSVPKGKEHKSLIDSVIRKDFRDKILDSVKDRSL